MTDCNIALFGEAEKGEFERGYYCYSLPQLADLLGNPPKNSLGLYFAIQALLFKRNIIFFRVKEEGYSVSDYLSGMQMLQEHHQLTHLEAIGVPGVGNSEIIHALKPICLKFKSIVFITEMDFFDYMMEISCA
jgi:hypothetical protein